MSPWRTRLAVTAALAIAALLSSPIPSPAQQNNPNKTGLPLYPKATTGSQYPESETRGRWYLIYTAQTSDAPSVVEAWYRQALPKATETRDDNQLTHGIVLTAGKDKVLVYQLGKRSGTVIELHKYLRGG